MVNLVLTCIQRTGKEKYSQEIQLFFKIFAKAWDLAFPSADFRLASGNIRMRQKVPKLLSVSINIPTDVHKYTDKIYFPYIWLLIFIYIEYVFDIYHFKQLYMSKTYFIGIKLETHADVIRNACRWNQKRKPGKWQVYSFLFNNAKHFASLLPLKCYIPLR